MARTVAPRRVARLQRRYLGRQGATPEEIQRWLPILTAQIGAESNFTQGVGSPAGARDIAQFMPTTAPGYGVTLGDNRIKDDIRGQVRYMLPLLRQHGAEDALRGYNAGVGAIDASRGYSETNAYVDRVLSSAKQYRGVAGRRGGGGRGGGGGDPQALLDAPGQSGGGQGIPQGSEGILGLLQQLVGGQRQAPSSAGIASPEFSAAPAMPAGAGIPQSSGGPAPKPDIGALLAANQTVGGDIPGGPDPGVLTLAGGGAAAGGARPGRRGRARVLPGADRAGVSTAPYVVDFAREISRIAGGRVRIGTGTNHSQYTVNGNVSDHWSGDAGDVPASGRRLIELGQAALIAAGAKPGWARKQRGGLYNVNGAQIIFNTQEGGDHTDHLHFRPPPPRKKR